MAEYAGLEIRIGGNTTKLTNALKASTKSAAELQSRIRQVTRAMQFDPTDLKNVETRVKLTGDRMQSLQSKAQIARKAMEQLGDSMVTLGGKEKRVRDVASETENLSLKAKQADERFVNLTGTLAKIYEAWNNVGRDSGADFLTDQLGLSKADADRLMKATTSTREFASELREIQAMRADLLYSGSGGIISDADLKRAQEFKALNFHAMFERGMDLDDVIADAERLGVTIEDSAIANVRELQKTLKAAQADKSAFDKALQFDQIATDVQRLDSEAEGLSQTMRTLDDGLTETTKTRAFQNLESEVRRVDAALDNVEADLKRTGEALKADPKNVQLAARYMDDLRQKASLSEDKLALLGHEMNMLNGNGAREAAKGHEDLAKWVEESGDAARVAKKELSDQQATVANLDDEVARLRQHISDIKGDSTIAQYSEGVIEWQKQTGKLSDAMGELAKKQANVATEQEKLGEARSAFDGATAQAEEYESRLKALRDEQRQLLDLFEQGDPSTDYASAASRLNELEGEIQQVETAYKGAQTNVELFSRELAEQDERAKNAQGALEQQQQTVDDLKKSVDNLAKSSDVKLFQNPSEGLDDAQRELEELEGELDRAKGRAKELDGAYKSARNENELAKTAQAAREVSQEADEAAADLKRVADEMDLSGGGILNASTVKSLGMTLSATVTPFVAGIGHSMLDASADVDAAYRDMRKTVDGTEEQFEHLKSAAIDFSRTHVTSAEQILQIEAIGGELGIATENLETFAEVISNLDVATNLDTEGAAETLGHLANIMQLSEDDYVGFSDALVRLGNNGASTETEIANIAERIGSMASIVGMSGSDVLAFASTVASTGQNAEAAGTAISKTMSFMETAVSAAGGTLDTSFEAINQAVQEGGDKLTVFASLSGKTVDEFVAEWDAAPKDMASTIHDQVEAAKGDLQMIADVAHMSADEFAQTWESDPTQALKAFIEGLNDIEGAGGSADKVLVDLGIKSVRQKQAIEGLMQTVGGLDDNLKMSEDAWNGVSDQWGQAGDAANEAAKKAEGFSGKIQILKNMWQSFLSELGEGAVPWVTMLTDVVSRASTWFSGLTSETKKWIVALGGVAAAAGPVLAMGSTLATSKNEFKKWFDTATSGMNLVRMAFKQGETDMVKSLLTTGTALDKTKLALGQLSSTLLKGLAVGAVVAGIVLIAMKLKELHDRYEDHVAATTGLSRALGGVGKASEITADGFDAIGMSMGDLAADSAEYESRLADLTKTIEDSNRQYGTYAGTLDYYAGTIEELGGKSELTQDEANRLSGALQAVNEACGTTYALDEYGRIIDTETGKIQNNTDEIRANIDARKAQALIDYYSDDYQKAVGEHAEAQEKLNEATERYEKLATDDGRKKFISDLQELHHGALDASDAQATYEYELSKAKEAQRNYQVEVNRTGSVMTELEGKMARAEDEVKSANDALAKAAEAQEEYDRRSETVAADVTGNMKRMSEAVEKAGGDDAGFNAMAEGLEAIHAGADELNKVDMGALASAFDSTSGSMQQVVSTLEDGGVVMSTWNAALEAAPGAAENMGSVTAAAFQTMYDSADHNLNDTMTLIAGLDAVEVGDKTFYIGDNGSITDSQGRVYDIKQDLASIPDSVITQYYVDDKEAISKAQNAKKKLRDVNNQKVNPKIGVRDDATKKAETLQGKLSTLNGTTAKPTVNLSDNASGKISDIRRDLDNINGKTVTTYVKTVKTGGKQATGGLNSVPVIPEHATGYIATGPTLTNQGWIGEDGIEAVANWATGGAVVPLTNRRYMLPIADAIADGMAARMGAAAAAPQVTVTVTGVSSPDEVADAIARKLTLLGL